MIRYGMIYLSAIG